MLENKLCKELRKDKLVAHAVKNSTKLKTNDIIYMQMETKGQFGNLGLI